MSLKVAFPSFPHNSAVLLALVFAAALGCDSNAPIALHPVARRPVSVKTVAVTTQPIQRTTTQPATIYPYYEADIRSQATGFVSEIRADIGDFVQAGDVLAIVDVPELRQQRLVLEARIERHQADEARRAAGVELAEAKVTSANAKLVQSQSEAAAADASAAAAVAEFDRTEDLVQRQSLQARMLDEARLKRDSQSAVQKSMAATIDSAAADVSVAEAERVAAAAELAAAQAETKIVNRQLDELDVLIDYASIKSPLAGVVTDRSVDPGDLVRRASEVGSGRPLFVVSQMETVRVSIPVPEVDAPFVSRGDEVKLVFPSFASEMPIIGKVARTSSRLDPSTRTMIVELELPNPDGKLLAGMFGQATINVATQVAANMLPARAIRFTETGQAYVYVVGDDDAIKIVNVSTGMDEGNIIEIISGVEPGVMVVDAHLKRFTEGQRVAVLAQ